MSALSCGQIDPLWYDIGLYRHSKVDTVRMPQPENDCGLNSFSTTLLARSGLAMPV